MRIHKKHLLCQYVHYDQLLYNLQLPNPNTTPTPEHGIIQLLFCPSVPLAHTGLKCALNISPSHCYYTGIIT